MELVLLKNVIINLCITGLQSEDKQETLEKILQSVTTDTQFEDIKRREQWSKSTQT